MADLTVNVVSADAEVWSGDARQVIARTSEGEIGVLSGHEPILAILAEGEVRITALDGTVITAKADDGFLSVQNDVITIVAGTAELA